MRNAIRALVAWALVVLGVFAVCRGCAKDPATAPSLPAVAGYVAASLLALAAAVVLVAMATAIHANRKARRLYAQGTQHFEAHQHADARAAFEEGERAQPRWPSFGLNRGQLELLRWNPMGARAHFERAWKLLLEKEGRRIASTRDYQTMRAALPQWIAVSAALAGDIAAAQEWLAKAGDVLVNHAALMTRVTLACRASDFPAAARELAAFDVSTTGYALGVVALTLHSWSLEQTGGEARPLHPTLFAELQPGALESVWPELAAFIARAPRTA
jgi:hypothetical protein